MQADAPHRHTTPHYGLIISIVFALQAVSCCAAQSADLLTTVKNKVASSWTWWGSANGLADMEKYFALPKNEKEDVLASLSSYLVRYASIHEIPRMIGLNFLFGPQKKVCLVPSLEPLGGDYNKEVNRILEIIRKFKNLKRYSKQTYQAAIQKDSEDIKEALQALERIRGVKDFNEKVVRLRDIRNANLDQMQQLNSNIYYRLYGYPVVRYLTKYPARLVTLYWNYARAAKLYWDLTVRLHFLNAVQENKKFKELQVVERVQ